MTAQSTAPLQIFTCSGPWTKPAGAKTVTVESIGDAMARDEADFDDIRAMLLAQQLIIRALLYRILTPAQHGDLMDFLDFLVDGWSAKPNVTPQEQQERERLRQGMLDHIALYAVPPHQKD